MCRRYLKKIMARTFHSAFLSILTLLAGGYLTGCAREADVLPRPPYMAAACPPLRGLGGVPISGVLVREPDAARVIAQQILRSIYTADQLHTFSGVRIEDSGDKWSVHQIVRGTAFSSTVRFSINKCNGAVGDVEFME